MCSREFGFREHSYTVFFGNQGAHCAHFGLHSARFAPFSQLFCLSSCGAVRSWLAKNADCNPSIVLWGRNFKPYKKVLPYFIFIKLSAQEVRICSEVCFNSKRIFFSYEFSTFFDLFAKNKSDVRGQTLSFFCLFEQFS